MRALVLSDIHGSALAARTALANFEKLKCELLFLLGDLLYHGPRNPLPGGHDPAGVAEILNEYKEVVVAVRGNCDAEVDQVMFDFPCLADSSVVVDAGRRLFLSHGHIFDPDGFGRHKAFAYLSGHTHVYKAAKNRFGTYLLNPGSPSLPKGGNPPTFGLYETGSFSVLELNSLKELARIALE